MVAMPRKVGCLGQGMVVSQKGPGETEASSGKTPVLYKAETHRLV
jgi:hypothetical protein